MFGVQPKSKKCVDLHLIILIVFHACITFVFSCLCLVLLLERNEPNEGDVRLSGSNITSEGRVEIYHDGRWGSVCDDSWDLDDAHVVCRQLNYQRAIFAMSNGVYGQGAILSIFPPLDGSKMLAINEELHY